MNIAAEEARRILVTGGSSGLGLALVEQLHEAGHRVMNYDTDLGLDVRFPNLFIIEDFGPNVLINCAGVNKIDWIEKFRPMDWDEVMDVNAKGIFMMTQACLPSLRAAQGTVINIVSNAATMPMRCSSAYNASKGAAKILSQQLARELSPDVTVFSVSPNKLAGTGMSLSIDEQVQETRGWTSEKAREYQLAGLLTHEETPPELVAEFITFLLSSKARHKFLTGCDIPYGA